MAVSALTLLTVVTGCSPIVGRWVFERTEPGILPRPIEQGYCEFRDDGTLEWEIERVGEAQPIRQGNARYQYWHPVDNESVVRLEWDMVFPGGTGTGRRYTIISFLEGQQYFRTAGAFFIPTEPGDWKIVFRRE